VAGAVTVLGLACPAVADPDASSLLFEAPALAQVPTDTTLVYSLERIVAPSEAGAHATGTARPSSRSAIELSLRADAETGERQAKIEIVTAEGRQPAGPFPSLVGNPVLLVLLERDVAEMSRSLRGSPYYIRNRIREALGETTIAEPARFTFQGRVVEGWRVAVTPFAQDRNRDRLREHAARRYEFTLSDAVPGSLYEMRMTTPNSDGTPLLEERLAFERMQPPEGEAR
jgi:hypothetical protein